jgi:hypothetical protein
MSAENDDAVAKLSVESNADFAALNEEAVNEIAAASVDVTADVATLEENGESAEVPGQISDNGM